MVKPGTWLLLACISTACNKAPPPPLARIDDVGPAAVEPGDVLTITGQGFIEGDCRITFDGQFKPDSIRASEGRRVTITGTAVSEQRIEVPMDAKNMRRLVEEPATFRGSVTVGFPISDSAVRITAALDAIELSLTPGGLGVATAARRLRRAEVNLRRYGIELTRSKDADSLVVRGVTPESPAAEGGVSLGDRILAVDGQTVTHAADFSVIDPGREHRLELVTRTGVLRGVTIPPVLAGGLDSDELTAVVLSCLALGLFLAFAAPSRYPDRRALAISADPITHAVGFFAAAIGTAVIPAVAGLGFGGVPIVLVLFAAQGAASVILLLLTSGRGLAGVALRMIVIPTVTMAAGLLSSGLGLSDIVASQQSTAYGPHALSSPFAFVLSVAGISLVWPTHTPKSNAAAARFRPFAVWTSAVSAASVITACFFGGWNVPFVSPAATPEPSSLLIIGTLVFMAKTWLVILVARWFSAATLVERRRNVFVRDNPIGRTAIFALAAVGTVVFHLASVSEEILSAGHIVATALFVTFSTALLIRSIKALLRGRSLARQFRQQRPQGSLTV